VIRVECLVERCAGLDIGKADLKACVRVSGARGGRRAETRTFATTTGALLGLRQWLAEVRVTVVGMEATGDYRWCATRRLESSGGERTPPPVGRSWPVKLGAAGTWERVDDA